MDPEGIRLSEISRTVKDKFCDLLFVESANKQTTEQNKTNKKNPQ